MVLTHLHPQLFVRRLLRSLHRCCWLKNSPLLQDTTSRVGLSWVWVLKGGVSGACTNKEDDGIVPLKAGGKASIGFALGPPDGRARIGLLGDDGSNGSKQSRSDGVSTSKQQSPVVLSSRAGNESLPTRVVGKISKDDVKEEVKFWESSVVCYVTSANPPLKVIDGFVSKIWKDLEIDKVGMVNRGVFLVRFLQKDHQERACDMNRILFDKKPFVVKPWSTSISYEKSSISRIPVWIKLPRLDVRYWT